MPSSVNDIKKASSISAPGSSVTTSNSAVVTFLRDLDKIQEQQMYFSKKIEKEKRRKAQLDDDTKVAIVVT
jgi:hypothetical protein